MVYTNLKGTQKKSGEPEVGGRKMGSRVHGASWFAPTACEREEILERYS